MACILSFVQNNEIKFKAVLLGKLTGAQCSEPVKSRVPSIWFVWKIWDFLVIWGQTLETRGHQVLLNRAWLVLKDFLVGGGEAETDTILKTKKPLGRDPWNDKDHVTGIHVGHEQKVTKVMAHWAEFCRFLECKEIATGHNKKNRESFVFTV